MQKFIVQPLIGIEPVRLGMTRDEVRSLMPGEFKPFKQSFFSTTLADAYFSSCFRIYYDENDNVEYIELSGYKSPDFTVEYNGIDIFSTKADDLIEEISKQTPYDKDYKEIPYAYFFPAIELSLWRPIIPDNEEGGTEESYFYFQTIGIRVRKYPKEDLSLNN